MKTVIWSAFAIILLELTFGSFTFIQDLAFGVLKVPMAKAFDFSFSSASYLDKILNIRHLVGRNQELEKENGRLLSENIELNQLRKENILLKKQAQLRISEADSLELANIFWISRNFFDSKALISKGRKYGVKEGDLVVINGDVLAGKIVKAEDNFSSASLISDSEALISVSVLGKNISGLIKSDGQKNLWLDLIGPDEEIKEGDVLITNGFDGLLQGLKAGRVKSIENNQALVVRKISVDPLLKFDSSLVFIIKR
mgnify:CR=1 FL=1